ALGRRITENPGTQRDLYYSKDWQVLEERVGGNAQVQYVWSPVYVDALVERDRDADGNPANGLEERLYGQQDANFNGTAGLNTAGAVQERYVEDQYGQPTVLAPDWSTRASSLFAWNYLHQGGRYDSASGLYNFRNRDYSPTLGRWTEVDPLGFGAGDSNLYRDVWDNPINRADPSGLLDFFVRPGEGGTENLYVVREWFGIFARPSTERWVGIVRPDGRIERDGMTATRGAVETAGYEDWDTWFRENGSEINPSAVELPPRVSSNADGYRALDPNFDQRGPQARGMVVG